MSKNILSFHSYLLPLAISLITLPMSGSWADTRFGETGETGVPGQDGRNGSTEPPIQINADGTAQSYDLRGGNGEDGTDGNIGQDATVCEQPERPEFSLVGASGGNGGRGGNGGNGGNGGSVTIFFDNIANLRQIQLINHGGEGGRSGRGQIGGRGCGCTVSQWTVNYCTYERLRRPAQSTPPAGSPPPSEESRRWQSDGSSSGLCRGGDSGDYSSGSDSYIQNWRQYRNRPWTSGNWEYRMERRPSYGKTYTCQAGTNGAPGRNGNNGKKGSYGRVTLVPVPSIPTERLSSMALLRDAVDKTETLVANVWVRKQGLRQLLASGSQVSNNYVFLQETLRPRHRIEWAANGTPQSLGIELVPVGAKVTNPFDEVAQFSWQIPDTIEYETFRNAENIEVAKITGGFAPQRLTSFVLTDKFNGQGREITLNIVDRGNLRQLLRSSQIELICQSKQSAIGTASETYQERQRLTFKIPSNQQQPNDGMKITRTSSGDQYEIPVGRYCYPWLKPGYEVRIRTEITQTIKAERTVKQNLEFITQMPQ
ncbi:MAG: hypothetical protein WCO45_04620 [Pseudanabaena sp. ELA607]